MTFSVRSTIRSYIVKVFGLRGLVFAKKFLPENRFLSKIRGVIHVGANSGFERHLYDAFGLRVLWVEPIPAVFEILSNNISSFPSQRALNYLVTAEDGKSYEFHIANNGGHSSSILDFSKHKEMFPEVTYTETVTLTGARLATLMKNEGIDVSQYDALVLDTQGSECSILRGASDILGQFRFVKVEVADFEAYENCCQIGELSEFMSSHGYRENHRSVFCQKDGIGTYFDVLYQRQ